MDKKSKVLIYEVGPRDGLQNEKIPIETQTKIEWINMLSETGVRKIEATSFVSPKAVPQLADAEKLFASIKQKAGVVYSALVPNLKGWEKAKSLNIREIAVFTAASESFTQKNTNCSIKESMTRIKDIMERARQNRVRVRAYISTVIECPYEGKIKPEKVLELTDELLELGAYEISLGETIGVAVPDEIARLLEVLLKKVPAEKLAGHYHDTRGTALLNVFRSLEYGIRVFDTSSGGLGGCPYAPGAAGNLATEDLVYALERSGYETGIDMKKLILAGKFIADKIQKPLPSRNLQSFCLECD